MLALSDDTTLLISLSANLVMAVITAIIANSRGRSAVGWFFVGFLAGCIGLILVLVLPDVKQQEAQMRRQEQENRRLREQLAKERQVADQRQGHVERRLGAHDQALGVDTSSPDALPPASAPPPLPLTDGATWFYARGQERLGPVTADTIRHLMHAKAIARDTLVWRDGMTDWTPAAKTDEFRGAAP